MFSSICCYTSQCEHFKSCLVINHCVFLYSMSFTPMNFIVNVVNIFCYSSRRGGLIRSIRSDSESGIRCRGGIRCCRSVGWSDYNIHTVCWRYWACTRRSTQHRRGHTGSCTAGRGHTRRWWDNQPISAEYSCMYIHNYLVLMIIFLLTLIIHQRIQVFKVEWL